MTHTYTRPMDAIASLFAARRLRFSAMSEDQRTSLVTWVNVRIVSTPSFELFSSRMHSEATRIHSATETSLKLARVALKLSAAFFFHTLFLTSIFHSVERHLDCAMRHIRYIFARERHRNFISCLVFSSFSYISLIFLINNNLCTSNNCHQKNIHLTA